MKRAILAVLILPVLCLCITGVSVEAGAAPGIVSTEGPGAEVCFPAADWSTAYGASAEDRPCDVIQRPQEDGSGTLYLGTLGADAAVCTIPNPYEERGRFSIQCHRVPNR